MNPTEKLKVGLIGAGKMGSLHLKKFMSLETCQVSGVYDSDYDRSKSLGETNKVKVIESLEEIIFESDAVVVASSSDTHYSIVKQALNSSVHVLVEKPLALNSKEARELDKIAQEKKLVLQVGFVERFRLKELSHSIKLIGVQQIECERIAEGTGREPQLDVVTDLMIHDLDLILSLNPGKIRNIKAKGVSVLNETLDVASVELEFESGVSAHLIANRLGPSSSRKTRFLMQNSYCEVDFNLSTAAQVRKNGLMSFEFGIGKDFLFEQAKSFCESIQHLKNPLVSAYHGTRSIELVEEILNYINQKHRTISSRERMVIEN